MRYELSALRSLRWLARPDNACEAGAGFGETLIDDGQQCHRRERLAQTARRPEFERHAQEVRRRCVEVGESMAGHGDQRNRRRALVEYPDRFETAHVRHEDIDNHQVEARTFQRAKPGISAIGYRYFKAVAFERYLDGHADHGIIIDD